MNQYESITDIKQRQIKFLNDTVAHYRLGNRSVAENGTQCLYLAKDNNTEGCAIGRHLNKGLAKRMDEREFGSPNVCNEAIFDKLPAWMKEMGVSFLSNVQSLHDHGYNWNNEGISEIGLLNVKLLKKIYQLN